MLFINGKSLACATSHSLSISTETSDTSHKDIKAGWKSSEIKSFSWEVSTENLFSTDEHGITYDELVGFMISKTELTAVFGEPTSADTVPVSGWIPKTGNGYTGKVKITNISLNAPNGDNATYTATFMGIGPLSKVQ